MSDSYLKSFFILITYCSYSVILNFTEFHTKYCLKLGVLHNFFSYSLLGTFRGEALLPVPPPPLDPVPSAPPPHRGGETLQSEGRLIVILMVLILVICGGELSLLSGPNWLALPTEKTELYSDPGGFSATITPGSLHGQTFHSFFFISRV
jgi:hypothetical protein